MEILNTITEWLANAWNKHLFQLGETSFTSGRLIFLIVGLTLLFYLTNLFKRLLVKKVFPRYDMDVGVSQSIATITRYIIVIVGFFIILQSSGIDLSSLGILFGALGIGIGFGLQNITSNFISGIIILFERPIKVGDRIEVGGTHGMVARVSPRATTIITNDNVSIIVPNSEFISGRVINWSHHDRKIRFRIPVAVAYGSDVKKVVQLLLEVANEDRDVLKTPKPDVRMDEFGDDGITFTLLVWTTSLIHRRGKLMSNINFAIYLKFQENGIEIPFPQRDLHLKSGFDQLKP
jgi:small-conductance mechanosensitive channel